MKTLRELSVAGPCITLGLVLRETDRRISYRGPRRHAEIHQQALGNPHRTCQKRAQPHFL